MKFIKDLSLETIYSLLLKKVRFKSDCEFFSNFDVKCKIMDIHQKNNEILFEVIVYPSNKHLTIGSNMKNLSFEIL